MALVLEIPDAVESALRLPDIDRKKQILEALAVALYARGVLGFGKARELAGLPKHEFGLLLGRTGVARHYSEEELEDDLKYARGATPLTPPPPPGRSGAPGRAPLPSPL